MSTEDSGLKVLKASITNFKNITHKEVELNGRSVMFVGPNNVGKSSLIQAICSPINSKFMPLEPIKKGEERAKVEITIGGNLHGEEVKYIISSYFSPEHSRGRLVVENEEGAKLSGAKTALQDIIGNIGFDIMDFIRLGRTETGKVSSAGVKQQIEILKSLMPKEVIQDLYKLDQEKEKIYKERTDINSQIRFLEGNIQNNHFTVEQIELYKEEKKASDISEQIKAGKELNDKIYRANEIIAGEAKKTQELSNQVSEIDKEIERLTVIKKEILEKEIPTLLSDVEKCKTFVSKKQVVDIEALEASLDDISSHNVNVQKVKSLKDDQEKLSSEKIKSENITKRLAEIEEQKKKLFSSSALPVKGLEFDEEKVMFNGLPLNEDQIPTSQLIAIGLRLGMAMNPNLRLLVIKDGSLIDEKTMNYILQTCEKKGYQIFIEMVERKGTELSIEFIEKDGTTSAE